MAEPETEPESETGAEPEAEGGPESEVWNNGTDVLRTYPSAVEIIVPALSLVLAIGIGK